MRNIPREHILRSIGMVAFVLVLAAGCATRRYVGPTTGRSADMQIAVSMALDNVLSSVSFDKFAGEKCFLEVFSLAETFGGESPENAVIRGAFAERLARDGVLLVTDPATAEIRLSVRARVIGVNIIRRDFPPLYYRETTTAVVDLHMVVYSGPDRKLRDQLDARRRLHLAQSYILYIIGPFESYRWD